MSINTTSLMEAAAFCSTQPAPSALCCSISCSQTLRPAPVWLQSPTFRVDPPPSALGFPRKGWAGLSRWGFLKVPLSSRVTVGRFLLPFSFSLGSQHKGRRCWSRVLVLSRGSAGIHVRGAMSHSCSVAGGSGAQASRGGCVVLLPQEAPNPRWDSWKMDFLGFCAHSFVCLNPAHGFS